MEDELRALGFSNSMDPDAPTCRWTIDSCVVDVIPIGYAMNAYHDEWTPDGIKYSDRLEVEAGVWIRHVNAPYLVAIKLETFSDRGKGEYQYSQDIDDIILLLDGRPDLIQEVKDSDTKVGCFIATEFRRLLTVPEFVDAIPAHLVGEEQRRSANR